MICTKKEFIRTGADGTKWWQVVLTADTDPDTLNLTGADVDNLNDELRLAAGSILITPTANYIAFEDGVFTAKGEGGGGGGGVGDLRSVKLTPDLETTPALASLFPINYDDLTDEEKESGKRIALTAPITIGDDFTATITPGSDWCVFESGMVHDPGVAYGIIVDVYDDDGVATMDINASVVKADDNDVFIDLLIKITAQ